MRGDNVVLTALACLAAGALIGILAAPDSGEETRKKISNTAAATGKKLKKLKGKAGSEWDDLKDIFQNKIEGLGDDVREKVLKLISSTKTKYNHVKESIVS